MIDVKIILVHFEGLLDNLCSCYFGVFVFMNENFIV